MVGSFKNKELDGLWKETAVAQLKAMHRYVPEGTEERHGTIQYDRHRDVQSTKQVC
jgi:hypothetical protein